MIIDLFAGGGGASLGIEWAMGRPVDAAVNHDICAVAMHQANHPGTRHFCQDVFRVHPLWVTNGAPVELLWASPDCRHFSKAKGGKPRSPQVRDLAWVVVEWARIARPRVIILENVEEFRTWGPLDSDGNPIRELAGTIFDRWVAKLRRSGYRVEWRELRACDYGAPTIRKRLFLIARRDGRPIVWPEPTHGPGRALPWRTAAECIDWSIPCPSIFERKRPLAENTLKRIAEGIRRYVIEAAEPFIVNLTHGARLESLEDPFKTITAAHRSEKALVSPTLIQTGYGERTGQAPRVPGLGKPLGTVVAGGAKHALVSAFLAKHYTGVVGADLRDPLGAVTAIDHHSLVAANLVRHFGQSVGQGLEDPSPTIMPGGGGKTALAASHLVKLRGTSRHGQPLDALSATITAGGLHLAEVRAFLTNYFRTGSGQHLSVPARTITTRGRLGLVTVMVGGEPYFIADIGLRMLQPRELFRAQGFPDSYDIVTGPEGGRLTKTQQVRLCGNSVPPQFAAALVRVNVAEERVAA